MFDDGASRHMKSSDNLVTKYRKCSGIVRTAGDEVLPIEGVGNIYLRFGSDSEAFDARQLAFCRRSPQLVVPPEGHPAFPLHRHTTRPTP